jgi:hypothetical protein
MTNRQTPGTATVIPRANYFFLVSFGRTLLVDTLFTTAVFFGFLVSFFRALLPLAMVSSWISPSVGNLPGFYTSQGVAGNLSGELGV